MSIVEELIKQRTGYTVDKDQLEALVAYFRAHPLHATEILESDEYITWKALVDNFVERL